MVCGSYAVLHRYEQNAGVPKPNGKRRLVIYWYVKAQLHGHEFPLPVIEDMLNNRQQGSRLSALLDLEEPSPSMQIQTAYYQGSRMGSGSGTPLLTIPTFCTRPNKTQRTASCSLRVPIKMGNRPIWFMHWGRGCAALNAGTWF